MTDVLKQIETAASQGAVFPSESTSCWEQDTTCDTFSQDDLSGTILGVCVQTILEMARALLGEYWKLDKGIQRPDESRT